MKIPVLLSMIETYVVFDVPDIFKAVRNVLSKYNFHIDGKAISWEYIKLSSQLDKKQSIRAVPRLSDSHINRTDFENMKFKLATQIISTFGSAGIDLYISFRFLPAEGVTTSEFLDKMDKLFDILNSSNTTAAKQYKMTFKQFSNKVFDRLFNFF